MRGFVKGVSDHNVESCKIKLKRTWMERKEIRKELGRIKNKNSCERHYKEKNMRALAKKFVECVQDEREHIYKQMK